MHLIPEIGVEQRPSDTANRHLALRFFQQAQSSDHLYILGDLFEYWLGDDAGIDAYPTIITALSALPKNGCGLTVMHGNRDFLLGEQFAAATGARLVTEDELVLQLGDKKTLLMHGDTLCTDDTEYLKFRAMVRDSKWQTAFLEASIDDRRQQAEALRSASQDANSHKQMEIMDVNVNAVLEHATANSCIQLIHGHTHRPAVHTIDESELARLVVGDWRSDHAAYVEWSPVNGVQLLEFR